MSTMAEEAPKDTPSTTSGDVNHGDQASNEPAVASSETAALEESPIKGDDAPGSQEPEAEDEEESGSDDDEDEKDTIARRERFATGKDFYCWQCHKESRRGNVSCHKCPRSYHPKCLPANYSLPGKSKDWQCPECAAIVSSEAERKESPTLSKLSDEDLTRLLRFALGTIKATSQESFHSPVSDSAFPDYKTFIIHPMDFYTIEQNLTKGVYKSTGSLLADIKWIVHNCTIYNNPSHTLTKNANYLFRVAKNEMEEMKVCDSCFRNYYDHPKSWFYEPCVHPHALAYAKLKGHPQWPAKVIRVDMKKKEADCRFFGAHDRAWVPFDSCFQVSEQYTWTKPKPHKAKLDAAINEMHKYIAKLNEQFPGVFKYGQPKEHFNYNQACLTDEPTGTIDEPEIQKTPAAKKVTKSTPKSTQSQSMEIESEDSVSDESPLVIDTPESTPANKRPTSTQAARGRQRGRKSNPVVTPVIEKKRKTSESTSQVVDLSPSPVKGKPGKKAKVEDEEEEDDAMERVGKKIKDEIVQLRQEVAKMEKQLAENEIKHQKELEQLREVLDQELKDSDESKIKLSLDEKFKEVINNTKREQWCAQCLKKAIYFCCWNCSYCSYTCQQTHWPAHMPHCQQQNKKPSKSATDSTATESTAPEIVGQSKSNNNTNGSNDVPVNLTSSAPTMTSQVAPKLN